MSLEMGKKEAIDFFSEFYNGEHNIPGGEKNVKRFGPGWSVSHMGGLSTYDSTNMTNLVIMAHEKLYRVEVCNPPGNKTGSLIIAIFKRQATGAIYDRHPDMFQALNNFYGNFSTSPLEEMPELAEFIKAVNRVLNEKNNDQPAADRVVDHARKMEGATIVWRLFPDWLKKIIKWPK